MARFGQDGYPKPFGTVNDDFLGVGTTVGYAIIVPAILVRIPFNGENKERQFKLAAGVLCSRGLPADGHAARLPKNVWVDLY